MSGRKKALVSVDRGALERIRELVERRRSGRIDFSPDPEAAHRLSPAEGTDLQSALASTAERIEALEDQLSGANSEIQRMEVESANRALAAVEALTVNAALDFDAALQEARAEWGERLENERSQRRMEMADMWETVETVESRDRARHEIAAEFLDAGDRLHTYINAWYDPGMIDAVQFDSFTNLLERAANALDSDLPEAAYTSAERAYLGLSEMRLALEEAEMLQLLLRQRVRQRTAALQDAVADALWVQPVDFEGNELTDEKAINVDYWAENARPHLENRLNQLAARVNSISFENASLDDLEYLDEKALPEIEKALDQCVSDALLNVIYAQVRTNITEMALHALQSQGYEITQNGIIDNNERRACRIRMDGPGAVGVDMKVSRMKGDPTASQLEMSYSDANDLTTHEINRRTTEINLALRKNGIAVEKMIVFQPNGPGGHTRPVDLTEKLTNEGPVVIRSALQS
jgi:hypothetical protein